MFYALWGGVIYPKSTIVLLLVVHMLLGYRQLRYVHYYRDDPLVRRLLGRAGPKNLDTGIGGIAA